MESPQRLSWCTVHMWTIFPSRTLTPLTEANGQPAAIGLSPSVEICTISPASANSASSPERTAPSTLMLTPGLWNHCRTAIRGQRSMQLVSERGLAFVSVPRLVESMRPNTGPQATSSRAYSLGSTAKKEVSGSHWVIFAPAFRMSIGANEMELHTERDLNTIGLYVLNKVL